MTDPRAVQIAIQLQALGVSQRGCYELMSQYPFEDIERQLAYLPYRKAKRPEAFIVDAIRNNYSAPKEIFYATPPTPLPKPAHVLDQDPQPAPRSAHADSEGHGATPDPDPPEADRRLEPGGPGRDLAVPGADGQNRPS